VLLLDISMPGMSGIDLAEQLSNYNPAPAVVFCTAYDQYAIAAFESHAIGYLLKPIQRDKLATVFSRLARLNQAQLSALAEVNSAEVVNTSRQQLCANSPHGINLLPVTAVRYFYADNKYVAAVHPEGELLLAESLKELEDEFADQFVRVHRNALVAWAYLQGIERAGIGTYRVRMQGIAEGPLISRRHLPGLRARLNRKP
jgi:two-component system response regulator AlgR